MGTFGKVKKKKREPRCSICGKIIPRRKTSIAEDVISRGGRVVGGGPLWSRRELYTICLACGSVFCLSCLPFPDGCPKCGKKKLMPA